MQDGKNCSRLDVGYLKEWSWAEIEMEGDVLEDFDGLHDLLEGHRKARRR